MNGQNQRTKSKKSIKKKYIILGILVLLVSIFSFSYAVLSIRLVGERKYSLTIGTLDFKLDNETNTIRLMNAYPMSDTEGGALIPYTFTLTNTGTIKEYYKISLITDAEQQATCSGCEFLSPSKLRYSLTIDGVVGEAETVVDQTVLEIGELTANQSKNYELRLWLSSEATVEEENKYYYGKIKVDASQEEIVNGIILADVMKEQVQEITDAMFNYTSEGIDPNGGESIEATNGIYAMEDDDGPSYFYRGQVDNLVKFGEFTKDYYVYRYGSYDFASLEACKYYNSSCSESNKVLKYAASDNVPMYWRIVRINGDGTIRMVYAGTSPDAQGQELGIGLSRYNEEYNDPKYTGYTYNKSSTETKSDAKEEIDTWYSNVLEGTTYDSKIATGKFCSDSSGYDSATGLFATFTRNFPAALGLTGNSSPTFKCSSEADANFGGSYNLKAGLMTIDEVIAAGGQLTENTSSYLYDTQGFWTMSPAVFDGGLAGVGGSGFGVAYYIGVNRDDGSLRPVINLRTDVRFKSGTDGSTTNPYELN